MENPSGLVSGNSQNTPTANVPRTRSTFDLKYHFFDTHRFGEYHPHYVEEGVKDDDLPIRSSHSYMSYTLKAPLMQDVNLYKDYFLVPYEAILPNNWSKFFENPVRGDDVAQDVGFSVEQFWRIVGLGLNKIRDRFSTNLESYTEFGALQAFLRLIILHEYFYSNGSLLTSLGCHGAPYLQVFQKDDDGKMHVVSYDDFFDYACSTIENFFATASLGESQNNYLYFTANIDGTVYGVGKNDELTDFNSLISFRDFICLMRDNPHAVITGALFADSIKPVLSGILSKHSFYSRNSDAPISLARLFAYQLVCAHYYTNDHIDFVYDANLYRQLIGNYIRNIVGTTWNGMFFTMNGIQYEYDYCSAHVFTNLVSRWNNDAVADGILSAITAGQYFAHLGYVSAVFSYRRSLKYQDYFTGSRAHPLAVGSTGVAVVGNSVDVVDVTRNIQRQRFLNAVNRVRHNFEGYLQGIFGGEVPAPDYHNPFFLASTADTIFGQETENTADAQMSDKIAITSTLRSNGSRYMLNIHCDRPCIILGISHYDIVRAYSRSIERVFFNRDRFDMFNPFMQYIGDQPIYQNELGLAPTGTGLETLLNFSYTLRHMEYKQRYSQAAGGFIQYLPGFVFIADDQRGSKTSITPEFIRSCPSEFDKFYVSLTGYSLGSYFHFIVDNFNDCTGSRPMAYAPSIL